ncbi:MAG: tetratricopeptide repeat protein [Flavobacteriales bacterium]|nr:tetratricopeptide repeat protein [Flavobacteriales bacterium]
MGVLYSAYRTINVAVMKETFFFSKKGLLFLFLGVYFFSVPTLKAQNTNTDSLWNIWYSDTHHDTLRLLAIDDLIWEEYRFTNTDSAYLLGEKQFELAEAIRNQEWKAKSQNVLGNIRYIQGNYNDALDHFSKALEFYSSLGDLTGYSDMLGNMAGSYYALGRYDEAIERSFQVLMIQEKQGDQLGIGGSYNNIGVIYYNQGELDKAFEYYEKGLKIREEIDDRTGISSSYLNIAGVYKDKGQLEKAKVYYRMGLEIKQELGDRYSEAKALLELGWIKHHQGLDAQALESYNKSLSIREEMQDQRGISNTLNYLAQFYYDQKNYTKAIDFGNRSIQISQELGLAKETYQVAKVLYDCYKEQGNYQMALEMHERYKVNYDSVMNLNNISALSQQEYNYTFRKNAIIDSIQDSNRQKIHDAQIASQDAEISSERIKKHTFLIGAILLFLFSSFMYLQYKRSLEQKKVIQLQKREVEQQKEQLSQELIVKNKELTNFALHLSQRNDFLREMKKDLSGASRTTELTSIQSKLKEIGMKFYQYSNDNKEEREFIAKLENLNETFYEKLSDQIPNISEKEKRLCSMLRLGLTSKEIASIVNISPKSVDVSRYRLRLKLNLPKGTDLREYLSQI